MDRGGSTIFLTFAVFEYFMIFMRNRAKRLIAIRKLIENEQITSQEELLFLLRQEGVDVTQGTLSRDLKFMRVGKIPHRDKGYVYLIPESLHGEQNEEKASTVVTDSMLSIDFSLNTAVIRTVPGYAKAVTVLIDNENYFEVLGTIGGDDTILVIMREGVSPKELLDALMSIDKDIHALYK
jgi:transcriptional regulator of arginine metabolism